MPKRWSLPKTHGWQLHVTANFRDGKEEEHSWDAGGNLTTAMGELESYIREYRNVNVTSYVVTIVVPARL